MSNPPDYAFRGRVIKLTRNDYDLWHKTFRHVEIMPYLVARDAYLDAQPEDEQKRWFYTTAQNLFNVNQDQARKDKDADRKVAWFNNPYRDDPLASQYEKEK